MKTRKTVIAMAMATAAICATPALADYFNEETTTTITTPIQRDNLREAEGMDVFGLNHEFLGTVIGVDVPRNLAEIQLPTGTAISIDGARLMNRGDHVIAPEISRADVMAMSREQNGTEFAMNLGTIPAWDDRDYRD